ncbi:copper amine oxidase 1 [Cordyceps fumosorosea ARSEF 2679]|uniref:Amine oxidase n=1 Tax=Cordyceps fumosorosea (strain ARSEF 2679) TaxID=1081104 RepID=A0A167LCZ1_CORFA|nr:copper amine oxidase 1 [Cordyceps fumosorosea ARSEF 2679]OAA52942.1 copper amine oxidase 1 [Cordyceps fumosorosea ARSEF 2679]
MLDKPDRMDFKPLDVIRKHGVFFTVTDGGLVEWQNLIHRLSFSELTVPYCDPRPPHHRKQAFDFGDVGAGWTANQLGLGCDCLGAIKYLDATLVKPDGEPSTVKNVICIHEQDDGILWKHNNLMTGRAVVVRDRKLIIQFIITLGNYEYISSYHLDSRKVFTSRHARRVSCRRVSIDPGKTSPYGTIVGPGVLAQNHQHIFAARIDAAIDVHRNTVTTEDYLPMPMEPERNPYTQ